jgi:divalent metal cation (Fe/Co/Zn/Cd) transporter
MSSFQCPAGSPAERPSRANVQAAWRISVQSIVWTAVASSAALVLGVTTQTVALVALGAVGFVDGIGSGALAYHFHHARRHDRLSEHIEMLAHRVVILGLFVVGLAAIAVSADRLVAGDSGRSSVAGALLAAASLVVLIVLSGRKRIVARLVASPALLTDSHLSGIGAMQAGIALVGVATTRLFDWYWADAAAALLVGGAAVALAISTWTHDLRG